MESQGEFHGEVLERDLAHVLEHTKAVWNELKDQDIFITGGTGFFGSWLLESFIRANETHHLNARVTVLTRDPGAFKKRLPHLGNHPSIHFHQGDVTDFSFPKTRFSHIIHTATPATDSSKTASLTMIDTIVGGTRRVLDFARENSGTKMLLTSSGAVYGKQPENVSLLSEDFSGAPHPDDTRSSYGHGKRLAEHLSALYHRDSNVDVKIARCFAHSGPYLPLDAHYALGNFIRDGLAEKPIQVVGSGTAVRSYLDAADLMIWLWTILTKGKPSYPYNVGSEVGISIADVARKVSKHFQGNSQAKVQTEVQILGQAKPGVSDIYLPSTQRARDELGLQQRIGLDQSIADTIAWNRNRDRTRNSKN